MYGLYTGHLHTAHRYALAIETLLHEVDLHAEMIISLAHDIVNEMLLNILEHDGINTPSSRNAVFLLKQVINNCHFNVRDDDIRRIVMITQWVAAINHTNKSDIGRAEAIKAMEYCNDIADLIEYNGYSFVRIRIPWNFDADENQRRHISRNDLSLSPALLDKIVNSIVEAVPTDTIYIFGSYSRLEETRTSDIDIYVVTTKEGTERYDINGMSAVARALEWWDKPKDIICLSRKQFDKQTQVNFSLEQKVLTKGLKIYES